MHQPGPGIHYVSLWYNLANCIDRKYRRTSDPGTPHADSNSNKITGTFFDTYNNAEPYPYD